MTQNVDSQIEEAKELFNKAFRLDSISKRNKFLNEGLEKFKEIEEREIDEKQKQKISNIKIAYSKELLRDLKPTPSVDDDMITFMILFRLDSDFENTLKKYPDLKTNYKEFKESLHRAPEFHHIMAQLKKEN